MFRKLSLLLAGLLWLFSVWQLLLIAGRVWQGTAGETPMIGNLLRPEAGPERWLPLGLLAVFGIILADLLFQFVGYYRGNQQTTAFARVRSIREAGGLQFTGDTFASRRVQVVRSFLSTNPYGLYEALPGAAALDSGDLETRFSHTKALIWALPVLGFIGTALGLATAIGGFSQSLKQTDPNLVVKSLGQHVIPGLSGAFTITMLALAAATVAHLCATNLIAAYQNSIRTLDDACLLLLAQIPRNNQPRAADGSSEGLAEILQQLIAVLQSMDTGQAAAELREVAMQLGESAQTLTYAGNNLLAQIEKPYYVKVSRNPEPAQDE